MFDRLPRFLPGLSVVGVALLVAGCMTLQPSTPGDHALQQGVSQVRTLPGQLPARSAAFAHAPFVPIQAESAAGMLVPVPFVSEAIGSVIDASAAAAGEARRAAIDPCRVVGAALAHLLTTCSADEHTRPTLPGAGS